MSDWWFKARALLWLLRDSYRTWREYIGQRDLNEIDCCSGYECACEGRTVRETWEDVIS